MTWVCCSIMDMTVPTGTFVRPSPVSIICRLESSMRSTPIGRHFTTAPATIGEQLNGFIERTGANELMITGPIFDHDERVRSYELLAGCGVMAAAA